MSAVIHTAVIHDGGKRVMNFARNTTFDARSSNPTSVYRWRWVVS